jgi:hypothetical protein
LFQAQHAMTAAALPPSKVVELPAHWLLAHFIIRPQQKPTTAGTIPRAPPSPQEQGRYAKSVESLFKIAFAWDRDIIATFGRK